jgi:23S rRNA (guanosine2251-2'-O)-methyltransferase
MNQFQIRQCTRGECRFRFPVTIDPANPAAFEIPCPKCGAPARLMAVPFTNYKEKTPSPEPGGPEVEALLDNIRSTYNVGSMFRTADGAGLRRLHLCGVTPAPGNPKIVKTALGAEQVVPWSYYRNAMDAVLTLKEQGMRAWALEGSSEAQSLFQAAQELPQSPILLVVGNELSGVDPGILEVCEKVVAIPMQGHKRSLNVAIAFSIAAYFLRFGLPASGYHGLI